MEKYILPNAMNCGCSYELFWTLNPHKLESFYEAQRMRIDSELTTQNTYAWLYGSYVVEAIASVLGKHHRYPDKPKNLKSNHKQEIAPPPDGESMSDGQRFYLFMLEHNKAMAKKRRRK